MTNEEIKAMQERLAALEDENRKSAEQLAIATATIEKASLEGKILKPVQGTFKAKFKRPDAASATNRTIKFKDGQIAIRLGTGEVVESEALLKLANGKELSTEELAVNPSLIGKDKEYAANRLNELAAKDYQGLEDA